MFYILILSGNLVVNIEDKIKLISVIWRSGIDKKLNSCVSIEEEIVIERERQRKWDMICGLFWSLVVVVCFCLVILGMGVCLFR